jgi:hypothetical protein
MAAKMPPQIPGDSPADAEQPTDTTLEPIQAEEPVQAELPRAADIDPTKISRSVLTQDGWVCPA